MAAEGTKQQEGRLSEALLMELLRGQKSQDEKLDRMDDKLTAYRGEALTLRTRQESFDRELQLIGATVREDHDRVSRIWAVGKVAVWIGGIFSTLLGYFHTKGGK